MELLKNNLPSFSFYTEDDNKRENKLTFLKGHDCHLACQGFKIKIMIKISIVYDSQQLPCSI